MSSANTNPEAGSWSRADAAAQGPRTIWIAVIVVAGLLLTYRGYALAWTCDDAFISFRYATNLVAGHGLVFNPGERVEGFTNLAWTLWLAVGLALGADAESWAMVSGLCCHAAIFAALAYTSHVFGRRERSWPALPLAPVCAALHADLNIYATSGLETPLFTLLLLLTTVIVTTAPNRWLMAGSTISALVLTRPDGLLVCPAVFAYLLLMRLPWLRTAAVCTMVLVPTWSWKVTYYGDWLPNTYAAKSAELPWWGQGWKYLVLYLRMYWVLALPVFLWLAIRRRALPRAPANQAHLGLLVAVTVSYSLGVIRAGGDFMFARLLIPVTPLCLLVLEATVRASATTSGRSSECADNAISRDTREPHPARPRVTTRTLILIATCILGLLLSPRPVSATKLRHGVSDEHAVYPHPMTSDVVRATATKLRPHLAGLPVRVAIFGTEARLAYYAEFPHAVECATGLTDREIARQPVLKRGQPGHEKQASIRYLTANRRAHLMFNSNPHLLAEADESLPECWVDFDGVRARALFWDDTVMQLLRDRGARVTDVPAALDDYVGTIAERTQLDVRRDLERFDRFYFDHNDDRARRAAITALLPTLRPR